MNYLKILVVFVFATLAIKAQEIEATVSVNMEPIPEEYRTNIMSLQGDVETYLNNQRFTSIEWEGPRIPIEVNIAITGGMQNNYSAQLFIASKRYIYGQEGGMSVALKLIDRTWVFEYNRGAMLSYNPSLYNEFTSLLDFYMLLIIGFDLDTYESLSGSRVYDLARTIVTMGAAFGADGWQTTATPGEFTRYTLISELTDLKFEPLRKLVFSYYYDGLDVMAEDREQGLSNLAFVIQEMADFKDKKLSSPSVLIQAFFDAKAPELADMFKGYKKHPGVFRDLMYLDPSNSQIYDESQQGR